MKPRDRPTSDSNEGKRKDLAGKDGAGAVNEAGEGREMNFRPHDKDAHGQRDDCADFDKGAQVVTRGQEQPHREH